VFWDGKYDAEPLIVLSRLKARCSGRDMPRLVLGSSSAFRRALFEEHFPLERSSFRSPDIDENAIRHTDAQTLTRLIANAKADALVEQMLSEDPAADALLICMDQVVVCDGCIREKPTSEAEARRFLASYQAGSKAECVNGCVVHDLKTGERRAANEIASVSFDSFPESTIDEAIAQGRIYNSSGAFAIDDPLFAPFVTRLEGARDAVIGLPLRTLRRLLDEVSSSSSSSAASSASAGEAADRDDGDARPPPKPVPSQLVPSQLVPGLVLRVLRPDDEAAAVALFASGMHETIISGLRAELVQPCRRAAALSLALLVALGVIARNWVWAMAMQLFGLGMAQAATVTAFKTPSPAHLKIEAAAMPAALGLCFALVCSALVYWLAPQRLASNYVNSCLEDDMKSPYAHYLSSPGSCFWVAIDDASGQVCG